MANFGATFRKARDSKGISLEKIAEETRISRRFLEAIEKEELHILPGGIFNRGFIRTFAERIGIDPDAAVSEYEQLIKIQDAEQQIAPAESPAQKAERNFYPLVVGTLVLAIIIFYIVTRNSGVPVQTATPSAVALPEQPAAPPLTSSVETAPEPAPPPVTFIALEIEALEQTWIKVIADGSEPQEALMEPGNTLRFTAQTSLTIKIGNAGGLAIKLNDQKMKSLGGTGQVREVIITPGNFKEFIG